MGSWDWVDLTPKEARSLPIAYFERFNASDVALPKFFPELTAKPSTPKTAARLEPTSERRAEKHVGWCLVLPTLMRSQRASAGQISRSEEACQIFRGNELHCLALALAIVISSAAVLPQVSYGTAPGAKASGISAFVGVSLIPRDSPRVPTEQLGLVRGTHIAGVGTRETSYTLAAATRIDGRGLFRIPGLADMPFHLMQVAAEFMGMPGELGTIEPATPIPSTWQIPSTISLTVRVWSESSSVVTGFPRMNCGGARLNVTPTPERQ